MAHTRARGPVVEVFEGDLEFALKRLRRQCQYAGIQFELKRRATFQSNGEKKRQKRAASSARKRRQGNRRF